MERHDLDATRLIGAGQTPISMLQGAQAMGQILDHMPDTQAVIGVSDLVAFGALTECQRRGVHVPDDIGIAGFGAYDISQVCHPTLTTIDPKPRSIGSQVAELIIRLRKPSVLPEASNETIKIDWTICPAQST
jgi:LacI family gluconate utilization system Gnt-I transcriptional repressor